MIDKDANKHVDIIAHYNHWQEMTTSIADEAIRRTRARGPRKLEIQGIAEVAGGKVFVLRFLQGRNPCWARCPLFAKYRDTANWLHGLKPAFDETKSFFEGEYKKMQRGNG